MHKLTKHVSFSESNTEWSIKRKEVDRELIENCFSFFGPPDTLRGKTDKLEEAVNRELNVTRS